MLSSMRTLLSRCSASARLFGVPRHNFSSTTCLQNKPTVTTETEPKKIENPFSILQEGKNHRVDNLEKRFLVWSGKYKRIEDVPPTVPQDMMEKARNKARIKISNYMIAATALACILFVYSGKQAAKRGESVAKMNLDWHQEIKNTAEEEKK